MEIIIELDPKSYECLLSRVPESSSAHRPLENATKLDSVGDAMFFEKYVIHCDEAQAQAILGVAKLHCLGAAPQIEKAISASRPPRK
jgi:hypothetical protein